MVHRIFWKTHVKFNTVIISEDQLLDFESDDFWVPNEFCNLINKNKNTLISKKAWLNDRIMDAGQKRICRVLRAYSNY